MSELSMSPQASERPFLDACNGVPTNRVPIWLMRQAGRYLPEYRALRLKHDFLELCRIPELCAEVTAQPIARFGFDAAILFSDILIPVIGMGVPVEFAPGPLLGRRIERREDLDSLHWEGAAVSVPHLRPVIGAARERLGRSVPLIGFGGAPFTLAGYLVDGPGAPDLVRTRSLMVRDRETFTALMTLLEEVTVDYLRAQIDAGVDAVMLFDSLAGALVPQTFERTAAASAERVRSRIGDKVPTIYFAQAATRGHLEALRTVRTDVLGIDYRVPLREARSIIGAGRAVQGNLDPAALLGRPDHVAAAAGQILRQNDLLPGFIFNLGQGLWPETPVENVQRLVERVKQYRPGTEEDPE